MMQDRHKVNRSSSSYRRISSTATPSNCIVLCDHCAIFFNVARAFVSLNKRRRFLVVPLRHPPSPAHGQSPKRGPPDPSGRPAGERGWPPVAEFLRAGSAGSASRSARTRPRPQLGTWPACEGTTRGSFPAGGAPGRGCRSPWLLAHHQTRAPTLIIVST